VPARRFPPVFGVYLALTIAQPVLLVVVGAPSFSATAIPLQVALLVGLAYGRPVAWVLLVVLNTAFLAFITVSLLADRGHPLVLKVLVLLFTTGALVATLLSPPMRRHVQARGLTLRGRRPVAGR
jgi:hypothetical protein